MFSLIEFIEVDSKKAKINHAAIHSLIPIHILQTHQYLNTFAMKSDFITFNQNKSTLLQTTEK